MENGKWKMENGEAQTSPMANNHHIIAHEPEVRYG